MLSAKKVLQTKNVPDNPMSNINASKAYLDKYTESLVLSAALTYFGMEDVNSIPTQHIYDEAEHGDQASYTASVLGQIVDEFALPKEDDITSSSVLACPYCDKTFKMMDAMRKHAKTKHTADDAIINNHDGVFDYSCATLSMCLIALDFTDARQVGDGERLIRLMKYMLLYLRSTGKSKYAYQVLRHLAQVKCFLNPQEAANVIWNRFINTKGKPTSNLYKEIGGVSTATTSSKQMPAAYMDRFRNPPSIASAVPANT